MEPGKYHLVGVAGVGMSALAQALAAAGCEVTGSDRYLDQGETLPVLRKLGRAGIGLLPQDGRGVTGATRAVVFSTAIESGNPDLVAAERLGVPLRHRAEILAALADEKRCVAVTGTSGKSTVTGMIGWILECAGRSPTVVNGAPVLNWCDDAHIGNYRRGSGDWMVIEADESDRSLLRYTPEWGVITNASADHFDLEETVRLFETFAAGVRGGCVSALHEPSLLGEAAMTPAERGIMVRTDDFAFTLPLLGRHNAENALLAARLCHRLDIEPVTITRALETFTGIERRLQVVGTARGVTVVDDYAHNPAKIAAAWRALATRAERVMGIWRPHGFGPLKQLQTGLVDGFAEVCRADDRVVILPVYDAGGTADRTVGVEPLVAALRARGVAADALEPDDVAAAVASWAKEGDGVVTMGARDPHLPALAEAILNRLMADSQGRAGDGGAIR